MSLAALSISTVNEKIPSSLFATLSSSLLYLPLFDKRMSYRLYLSVNQRAKKEAAKFEKSIYFIGADLLRKRLTIDEKWLTFWKIYVPILVVTYLKKKSW